MLNHRASILAEDGETIIGYDVRLIKYARHNRILKGIDPGIIKFYHSFDDTMTKRNPVCKVVPLERIVFDVGPDYKKGSSSAREECYQVQKLGGPLMKRPSEDQPRCCSNGKTKQCRR